MGWQRVGHNWANNTFTLGFPDGSSSKASPCNAGDADLIPGLGRSPGEENVNPLQYSCLGNLRDRKAWQGYSPWAYTRVAHDWAHEWEDYSNNLGEEAEISRNQATAHFLTFMVALGNYHGTWACSLACWCVTLSVYWGSRSSGSTHQSFGFIWF